MLKNWRVILLLLFSGLIGWFIGYFKFPDILDNREFLSGVFLSFSFICLGFLLLQLSKKKSSSGINTSSKSFMTLTISTVMLFLSIVIYGWVSGENNILTERIEAQSQIIEEMNGQSFAEEIATANAQIPTILETIKQDSDSNNSFYLSSQAISSLARLNQSLHPRKKYNKETDSLEMYSQERGQLLNNLIHMNLDSNIWAQIKKRVSFEYAYLANSDLSEADLSDINLSNAILSNCNLSGANFHHANLHRADFGKSELIKTCFNAANLTRANMNWTNAVSAEFVGAVLDGSDLRNMNGIDCDLSHASVQWADLQYIQLNRAVCSSADFKGSNLSHSNFAESQLNHANLVRTNISLTNMDKANLNGTLVKGNDWLELGTMVDVSGMSQIKENYTLVADSNSTTKFILKLKDSD